MVYYRAKYSQGLRRPHNILKVLTFKGYIIIILKIWHMTVPAMYEFLAKEAVAILTIVLLRGVNICCQ